MTRCSQLVLVATLAAGLSGCVWHKTKINERVRDLDVSQIVPGQTTWMEVLDQLGAPSSIDALDFITTGGLSRQSLGYTYSVAKEVAFVPIPYLIITPFIWSDRQLHRQILVEVERGTDKVRSVTVTSRSSVWPVWGDLTNDEPLHVDYDDGSRS